MDDLPTDAVVSSPAPSPGWLSSIITRPPAQRLRLDLSDAAVFEAMVEYNVNRVDSYDARFIYARGHYARSMVLFLLALHQVSVVLAAVLSGISVYVLSASWGGLDPEFFVDIGVCSLLFSLIVMCVSLIGWASLSRIVKRFIPAIDLPVPRPPLPLCLQFSQTQLLLIHSIFLLLGMAAEVYVLAHSFNALIEFEKTLDLLRPQIPSADLFDLVPAAPFSEIEAGLAIRFNTFFFGAMNSCVNANFAWWWDFIANNCQPSLQLNRCVSCDGASITSCSGDSNACFAFLSPAGAPQSPGHGVACPYSICRVGITKYLINQVYPFACTLLAVLALQALVLTFNFALFWQMRGTRSVGGFGSSLESSGVSVIGASEGGSGGGGDGRGSVGDLGDNQEFPSPMSAEEEQRQLEEALARSVDSAQYDSNADRVEASSNNTGFVGAGVEIVVDSLSEGFGYLGAALGSANTDPA